MNAILWYLGIGLCCMGIGATLKKTKYVEVFLCIFPIIMIVEPIIGSLVNLPFFPKTFHVSILLNSYEMSMFCIGFTIFKKLRKYEVS